MNDERRTPDIGRASVGILAERAQLSGIGANPVRRDVSRFAPVPCTGAMRSAQFELDTMAGAIGSGTRFLIAGIVCRFLVYPGNRT